MQAIIIGIFAVSLAQVPWVAQQVGEEVIFAGTARSNLSGLERDYDVQVRQVVVSADARGVRGVARIVTTDEAHALVASTRTQATLFSIDVRERDGERFAGTERRMDFDTGGSSMAMPAIVPECLDLPCDLTDLNAMRAVQARTGTIHLLLQPDDACRARFTPTAAHDGAVRVEVELIQPLPRNALYEVIDFRESFTVDLALGAVTAFDGAWTLRGNDRSLQQSLHLERRSARQLDAADLAQLAGQTADLRWILNHLSSAEVDARLAALEAADPKGFLVPGLPLIGEEIQLFRDATPAARAAREATRRERAAVADALIGKPAPELRLQDVDGHATTLAEMTHGQVTLLVFWKYFCGGCRLEAPHLSDLYEKYRHLGFTVVAVDVEDTSESLRRLIERGPLKQPIAFPADREAYAPYGVAALPTLYWIDRDGVIDACHVGFKSGDESLIEAKVRAMLARRKRIEKDRDR